MARTITRKTKMEERVVFRATQEDIANIKVAAMRSGMDSSGYIRQLLINKGVINAI